MDCVKVGKLIYELRRGSGMTQKQLADKMSISDKTVSKWERGMGCPDISLLQELSSALGVNIEKLLSGKVNANDKDGGNMKRTEFYVCHTCGNCITSTGAAEVSCCGRKLESLKTKPLDEKHAIKVETVEDDYYITFDHGMSKTHYIRFAAYLSYDRMLFVRLYPEQGEEVRFPRMQGGELYLCCSKDGLMKTKI